MTGKSDQEKASEGLFGQVKSFNPTAKNRFTQPGVLPHKPSSLLNIHRAATKSGVADLSRQTAKHFDMI